MLFTFEMFLDIPVLGAIYTVRFTWHDIVHTPDAMELRAWWRHPVLAKPHWALSDKFARTLCCARIMRYAFTQHDVIHTHVQSGPSTNQANYVLETRWVWHRQRQPFNRRVCRGEPCWPSAHARCGWKKGALLPPRPSAGGCGQHLADASRSREKGRAKERAPVASPVCFRAHCEDALREMRTTRSLEG